MSRESRLERQIVVRMPGDLIDGLQLRAAEDDRTVAQIVRRAVREYLAREGAPR